MSPHYPGQLRKDSADLQTWALIPAATDSQRRGSAVTRPAAGPPEPRDSRTLGEQRGWNPTSPLPSSQVSRSATLSLSFLLCKKGNVFVSRGCRHNHPKFSGLKTTGVFFSSPQGRKSKVGLAGAQAQWAAVWAELRGRVPCFCFLFPASRSPIPPSQLTWTLLPPSCTYKDPMVALGSPGKSRVPPTPEGRQISKLSSSCCLKSPS